MFRAILLALALATVNGLAVPSVIAQRLTLLTEELPPLNFSPRSFRRSTLRTKEP